MSGRLAIAAWVATMAMIGVGLVLLAQVPAEHAPAGAPLGDALPILPLPLSSAAVGVLIGWHRPGNRMGRLLSLLGLVSGLQFLLAGYAGFGLFSDHPLPQAIVAAWAFSWSGGVSGLFAYLLLFEFPNGPLPLRRTRFGLACSVISTALFCVALAIVPGTLFNISGVQNPFGVSGQEALIIALVAIPGLLFVAIIALAASTLRERYRRGGPRARLQLKWFLAGMSVSTVDATRTLALAPSHFALTTIASCLTLSPLPNTVATPTLSRLPSA